VITLASPAPAGSDAYVPVYEPGTAVLLDFACADARTPVIACAATNDGAPINRGDSLAMTPGVHRLEITAEDYNHNTARTVTSYRAISTGPVAQDFEGTPGDASTRNQVSSTCSTFVGPAALSLQDVTGQVPTRTALAAAGLDPTLLPFDPSAIGVNVDASAIRTSSGQATTSTLPLTVAAPVQVAQGRDLDVVLAPGEQSVPAFTRSRDFTWTWQAPAGATVVSATADDQSGTDATTATASVAVDDGGKVTLHVAGPVDNTQGQAPVTFTPPVVHAVLAATGAPGTDVSTKFASSSRIDDLGGLGRQLFVCTAPDATPVLTRTRIVDVAPPTASIASPADGALLTPGQTVTLDFACADGEAAAAPTCVARDDHGDTLAPGAALDVGTPAAGKTLRRTIDVTATDADGNVGVAHVSFSVRARS
jgi:hypothetical protein